MDAMSDDFLAWLRGRAEAAGFAADEVFDEREKDLGWLLGSRLKAASGVACFLSMPTTSRVDAAPAARQHYLSCMVIVRSNENLKNRNSCRLAEGLFAALDGAEYIPEPNRSSAAGAPSRANVACDQLTHSRDGADRLHSFTVKTFIEL